MIRLSKSTRIAGFAAAGLMSVGTMAGTATAALAATSSPTETGTVVPATMTAALKLQPSQVHQSATAKTAATAAKTAKASAPGQAKAKAKAKAKPAAPRSPKQIATAMLDGYGWTKAQFSYLDQLWQQESNWDPSAVNASSGAYGIAQALPASQMSTAGSDWQTNASTQIKWGLNYIKDRYGSPQAAWAHETAQGWY